MSNGKEGLEVLVKVLEANVDDYNSLGLRQEYFFSSEEREVFNFIDKFLTEYGKPPTRATVQKKLGILLPKSADEPLDYYKDQIENRYIFNTLRRSLNDVKPLMDQHKPLEAMDKLLSDITDLNSERYKKKIISVTGESKDIIIQDYKNLHGAGTGCEMGWKDLDKSTRGLNESDFVSIIGRPGGGKTYLSVHAAHNMWHKMGKKILFVSMEMGPVFILKRLLAIHLGRSYDFFKHAEYGSKFYKELLKKISEFKDKPDFHIIDGNLSSSVQDILRLTKQYKPDCVFVDGAYLLKGSGGFNSKKFETISSATEGLKEHIVGGCGIPLVASYQFNRDSKKVKNDEVDLHHIAGSDAIGQISSIVLGLFGDDDNVEESTTRVVNILKDRNGERGSFRINFKFSEKPQMDFHQYISPEEEKSNPKDLQY